MTTETTTRFFATPAVAVNGTVVAASEKLGDIQATQVQIRRKPKLRQVVKLLPDESYLWEPLQADAQWLAIRQGQDLQLHFGPTESIVLENYFDICRDRHCPIDDPWLTRATQSDALWVDLGHDRSLIAVSGGPDWLGAFEEIHGLSIPSSKLPLVLAGTEVSGAAVGVAAFPGAAWLGAGAGVAAAGGGGGGGESPALPGSRVTGQVSLGQILPNHGLVVDLWGVDANGRWFKLKESVPDSDGVYATEVGRYSGVVLAKVRNTPGPDYLDEATLTAKELDGSLLAAAVIQAGESIQLNVNRATTLAAVRAGVDMDADSGVSPTLAPSAAVIWQSKQTVAQALGLTGVDLTTAVPETTVNASAERVTGNAYGQRLAVLSGGESVVGQFNTWLVALNQGIQELDGQVVIRSAAANVLISGAALVHIQTETWGLNVIHTAPELVATTAIWDYTNDAQYQTVFSGASIRTVDVGQTIVKLQLTVTGVDGTADEKLQVDGSELILVQGRSGTTAIHGMAYTVSVSSTVATLTLTHSGLTEAQTAAVVNGLAYRHAAADGMHGDRTVTLTEVHDSGQDHNATALSQSSTVKDKTAPTRGHLSWTDTGSSDMDGITRDGVIHVGSIENGAVWEYSTDAGNTWTLGSGDRFTLSDGDYAAGAVQMRQTDAQGNVQTGVKIAKTGAAIHVDTKIPLAGDHSQNGTEDTVTLTGRLSPHTEDRDGSETYALVSSATGLHGQLTLRSDGDYSYTRTSDLNDLAASSVETFAYTVTDAAGNTSQATLTLNLTPVNDAPEIADTALAFPVALTNTGVVPVGLMGELVSTLVGGIRDADAAPFKGIAITGVNAAHGTLYFSVDAGVNWTEVDNVSDAKALLLTSDANHRLYFKHDLDFIGTTSDLITLRAWDGSSGSDGSYVNAVTNGGVSAFSGGTDTVSQRVMGIIIDSVSTDDRVAHHEAVVLTGKSDPGAALSVQINGRAQAVTADADGLWRYTLPSTAALPMVRYIMVRDILDSSGAYGASGVFNLTELQAFQGDTSLSQGKLARVSWSSGTVNELTDNNRATYVEKSGPAEVWVQVDLGAWYRVDRVELAGRSGWPDRTNGATLYTSANDMSMMTSAQLNAAAAVATLPTVASTLISGTPWDGALTSIDLAATDITYLEEGVNTLVVTDTRPGVTLQAQKALTLDSIAPATGTMTLNDTGLSAVDGITRDGVVAVSDLEAGSSWQYSVDGGVSWLAGSDNSLTLVPGTYAAGALKIRQTDAAGNVQTTAMASNSVAITVDATVPLPVTTNLGHLLAPIASSFVVSGTGEVGATVRVYNMDTLLGTALVNAQGTWSYLVSGLTSGEHTVKVEQLDVAGNVSTQVSQNITVDASAIPAPMLASASDSGIPLDNVTQVTSPVLNGVATANAAIEVWDTFNGLHVKVGHATAAVNGQWSLTLASQGEGAHHYVVKELASDGTVARSSAPTVVIVDTTAPAAASAPVMTTASDSGMLGNDGVTNVQMPTFTGQADGHAWVNIYRGGSTLVGKVQADGEGVWTYKVPASLADGNYTLTARQMDAAGNESVASTGAALTVDSAVAVPKLHGVLAWSNSQVLSTSATVVSATGRVSDINLETSTFVMAGASIVGAAPARAFLVDRSISGQLTFWTMFYDGTYTKAVQTRLSDVVGGGVSVQLVQAKYVTGNYSDGTYNFNTGGNAQTVGSGGYGVVSITATSTVMVPSPVLTGSGEVGAMVEVFDGGVRLGMTQVGSQGVWTYQASGIVSGAHSITTRQTDLAGNVSTVSSASVYTVDASQMSLPTLSGTSDSGVLGDGVTRITTPTLQGSGVASRAKVDIYDGQVKLGQTTATADGTWSFTPDASLRSGVHSILAKELDSGNAVVKTSPAMILNVDTTAAVPVLHTPAPYTRVAPVISGSGAEANATVNVTAVSQDGLTIRRYTTTANGSGVWSLHTGTDANALPEDKVYNIRASQTDTAGNTSAVGATQVICYDSSVLAPTLDALPDSNASAFMVTGSGEVGATVRVFDGSTPLGTAVVNARGTWSFNASGLGSGQHTIQAQQVDLAGNLSAQTAQSIVVDAHSLSAPLVGNALRMPAQQLKATGIAVDAANGASFTASAKFDVTGGFQMIMSPANSGLQLYIENGLLKVWTNGTINTTWAPDDQWHSYALVTNGLGAFRVYVDGVDVGGGAGASTAFTSINLDIGGHSGYSTRYVNGLMQGVKVWDVALTANEVNLLAQGQSTGQEASIKASYALMNNTLPTVGPNLNLTGLSFESQDSGVVGDNITRSAILPLRGTATAGATVEVWDDFEGARIHVGTTTVTANGSWSLTTGLQAEGAHSYVVKEVALDGTVLRSSVATVVTIDVTAPGAIDAPVLTTASDTGMWHNDGLTHVVTPTLVGQADAGAWVNIYTGGTTWQGTVKAADDGSWTFTVPHALADASYSFTAKQVDLAGNESLSSTATVVTVDSSVAEPQASPFGLARYVMLRRVNATGQNFDLGDVQVISGGSNVALNKSVLVGPQGAWNASLSGANLVDGNPSTVYASASAQTDAWVQIDLGQAYRIDKIVLTPRSGWESRSADTVVLSSLDSMSTTPLPALQASSAVTWGQIMGSPSAAGTTVNALTGRLTDSDSALPVFQGSGEAGAIVQLWDGGVFLGQALVQSDGSWRYQASSISSGTHHITLMQTDKAGNVSTLTSAYTLTVNPVVLSAPALIEDSDSGVVGDGATRITVPTLKGLGATAHAVLEIYDGQDKLGQTSALADGSWRFTPTDSLTAGEHRIVVKELNQSAAVVKTSAALSLTIDDAAVAPVMALLPSHTRVAPVIAGTGAEPHATVHVSVASADGLIKRTYSTTANASGAWQVDTGSASDGNLPLTPDQSYSVHANQTDVSGNISLSSTIQTITFDPVMNARLLSLGWRIDQGASAVIDAGDVVRLVFDQAVSFAQTDLPSNVFGVGAKLSSVQAVDGKSTQWDVSLGVGHDLAQATNWRISNVKDVGGNSGFVDGAQVHGALDQASIDTVNIQDVDRGVQISGWASPLSKLQLNWGGQISAEFTADASGYWTYSFYENESLFGRKIPLPNVDQSIQLFQINANQTTQLIWAQSARVDLQAPQVTGMGLVDDPASVHLDAGESVTVRVLFSEDPGSHFQLADLQVSGGMVSALHGVGSERQFVFTADGSTLPGLARIALPAQAFTDLAGNASTNGVYLDLSTGSLAFSAVRPLSQAVAVRASRSVQLDLRDPSLDMTPHLWQAKVTGLASWQTLSHGTRDSQGVWTVDAQHFGDLWLSTPQSDQAEQRLLNITYQQKASGSWLDYSRASVSLSVVPWFGLKTGQTTEDFSNFTQLLSAWNRGLTTHLGSGVVAAINEGTAINLNDSSDFHIGNVLAGSASMLSDSHAHGVGQRIAGSVEGEFVGTAPDANVKWVNGNNTGMDITNWSVGMGNASYSGQWDVAEVRTGRNGLGTVWVIAAGNASDGNTALLTTTKNPTTITVASVDNATGELAGFSSHGQAVWVAHPGWGGTSHAAPAVAGQVALMLEANPGLGVRDVKNILAMSATYYTTATPLNSFELNHARHLNGAGMHFSNELGFGVSNVYNAVRLAQDWTRPGLPAQTMANTWSTSTAAAATTALDIAAQAHQTTTVTLNVLNDIRLEDFQVVNTINTSDFSILKIWVTSPSGTVSELTAGSPVSAYNGSLIMTSHKFFGESSQGVWTVSYEFTETASAVGKVSHVSLNLFGNEAPVDDRHVYTDELNLHHELADAATQAGMRWLEDRNGGNDSVMGSALSKNLTVHLGAQGWLDVGGFRVDMALGTRIENAFGGDGADVLVGLRDGKSILLGNDGSDVLIAYGQGSELEGGHADDWLWLGDNSTGLGGQGDDRFMVFQGEEKFLSTAQIMAQILDFDVRSDHLFSYDAAGQFTLAQFDLNWQLTGWTVVSSVDVLQNLRSQLDQSAAPDILDVSIQGNTFTLELDEKVLHTAADFSAWQWDGLAPTSANVNGSTVSLSYTHAITTAQVLDLSGAELYSTLGVKLPYQRLYAGTQGADTLDASAQTGSVALWGQGGADSLVGGAGADLLVATTDAAVNMQGGFGADVFRWAHGALNGTGHIEDFNASEGDRLDLDALFQNIPAAGRIEQCVDISRVGNDAILKFDLTGQQNFAASTFQLELANLYLNHAMADVDLHSLMYASSI